MMLERWNDDKMDVLDGKLDELGAQMTEQRQELRGELKEQRQELRAELREQGQELRAELREQGQEMKAGFERVDDKFDRMHRTLLVIGGAVIAALVAPPLF